VKVIVTGSKAWPRPHKVHFELGMLFCQEGPFELIHGSRSTGADAAAHHWFEVAGRTLGCIETRWPASWGTGKGAAAARDARMVSAGADLALAFPLPTDPESQAAIKLAREAGIPVKEFKHA
jgi:hypothetical protein